MSEPIFEASVRLQADVSDFEKQAQASVKRVLDGIEQQTQQAIRGSQQRVAQASQLAQRQLTTPPPQQLKLFEIPPIKPEVLAPDIPPPAEVPQITITPVVEPPVVPPPTNTPTIDVPTVVEPPVVPEVPPQPPVVIPVEAELANIGNEIASATQQLADLRTSGEAASAELATVGDRIREINELRRTVPERVFQTQPEAAELAGLEQRSAALTEQISKERELTAATETRLKVASQAARDFRAPAPAPPPQLAQAVEQAEALATQPIDFTIRANTEQFERDTASAFATAQQLAEQNAEDTARIAEQAAKEAADATDTALNTVGDKTAAVAEANLKKALSAQAQAAKEVADDIVKQLSGATTDAATRPTQELQQLSELAATQAQAASLLGDEAGRAAKELESAVLGQLALAEQADFAGRQAILGAAETSGIARQQLEAEAQVFVLSAEQFRAEADRLRREGLSQPGQPGGGEAGRRGLGRFGELLGEGELARQVRSFARFGVGGFAFAAAFQGLGELQKELRVTGDEAFSTEGRIRNLGAELVTGNIVGGLKALTETGGTAAFSQGLEEAIKAMEAAQVASSANTVTEAKLIEKYQEGSGALEEYLAVLGAFGKISLEEAAQLNAVAKRLSEQEEATKNATSAWADYEAAVASAGSAATKFGREGGIAGRGPGSFATVLAGQGQPGQVTGQQLTGERRPIVTNPFPNEVFQAGTGGQEVGNRIRESLNQRIQSERERLQADLASARIIQQQARANFEAAKRAADGNGQAADEFEKLVTATTALGNAAQAVKDQAARAADEIQQANDRIANAQIAAIRDPAAQAQAQLARDQATQTREGNELEKAKAAFKKGTIDAAALKQAQAEYAEAVSATQITQNGITDAQEAATEAAKQSRLSAQQQGLENEIAKAALTARLSDDREAFAAAIAYWKNLASQAGTAEEREAAQAKVIALRDQRSQALQQDVSGLRQQQLQNQLAAAQLAGNIPAERRAAEAIVKYWEGQEKALQGTQKAQATAARIAAEGTLKGIDESAIGVEEQKIQNRIQAARLTKGLGDDKRAADALVAFWQQQVDDAEGADKVRKRANLIAARLARQGLEEQTSASAGGGFGTVDFLKISQGIFRDFASNLLPTGGPEAARALFPGFEAAQTQAAVAGIDTSDVVGRATQIELGEQQVDELKAIRRTLERNGAGSTTVNVTQNHRVPDPSGFAQARWARFAMEEAFNG